MTGSIAFAGLLGAWLQKQNTRTTHDGHASYRKCPQCGASDFRISDRQRVRPGVYGAREVRLKWLCLACDYRETENIVESA